MALGVKYFIGPKFNSSFETNANWIEKIVPPEAYCKFTYNYKSGLQEDVTGTCALQWAQPIQLFLVTLWFGYLFLVAIETVAFFINILNICCPCLLYVYKR